MAPSAVAASTIVSSDPSSDDSTGSAPGSTPSSSSTFDSTAGEVESDEDRAVEPRACYVQYGPEPVDVCRWTNCTLVAIP